MIVLLLPLVMAILICNLFYPLRRPWQKTQPNKTQTALYQRLSDAGLSGDELATVGALTLGYKEGLDKTLRQHFQASGAAHVLAVSGLHTGIIYALLVALLTLGGRYRPLYENKWGRRVISLIIIIFMWAYAWLTGMTPSVVRAVLMVTLFEFGRMIYRQSFSLNTIAAAAVLILLAKPSDLWSVSFQLSFAATAAIVVFMDPRNIGIAGYRHIKQSVWGKMLAYFIGILIVSLAAQLGTLGITIYYFHQASTYFLLTNLMVLPLATLLVPCGLATIALGGSSLGIWVGKATHILAWTMNHSVEWIESLPGCTVQAHASLIMVGIYYLLLLGLMLCIPRKA